MENIEDILRALTDENDAEDTPENEEKQESGGLFGSLDPAMLLTVMELFEKMNSSDDNERFLLALKPLLRDENKEKIDTALKFMKIFALLPVLKESGLLGKLF